uniref:Uncharacterized protein n=1 Tax=Chromera velia CCMP2878 TaxID=1169474 RepID=A0A0G4ICG9_9ALVE|mmetsp:Transcript_24155/g.47474  ORF Transcript_24155/g.47474 Transcript_24155/m.47474 type:complete len:178 (-) Transcript_24155:1397-1930(-)|eukprot:Cvel_13148.t1-p1 / transcript=Cvel_13148.t1 / gene=Cvel_13148 / organism=Chromera_velia_CCMP2878 / gene_product=hypothetical protein / transcript_product=hypothetical protein / location=Cvel_scaffold887:34353-35327(-) / protein_length=177 / sequence_SO=supercontig / SO=protein_coding / is_pseudo=false
MKFGHLAALSLVGVVALAQDAPTASPSPAPVAEATPSPEPVEAPNTPEEMAPEEMMPMSAGPVMGPDGQVWAPMVYWAPVDPETAEKMIADGVVDMPFEAEETTEEGNQNENRRLRGAVEEEGAEGRKLFGFRRGFGFGFGRRWGGWGGWGGYGRRWGGYGYGRRWGGYGRRWGGYW